MQTTTRARIQRLERDLTNANIELGVLRTILTPPTDDELDDWVERDELQLAYLNSVPVDAPCHPPWVPVVTQFNTAIKKKDTYKFRYIKLMRNTAKSVFFLTVDSTFDGRWGFWAPRKAIQNVTDDVVVLAKWFKIKEVEWND